MSENQQTNRTVGVDRARKSRRAPAPKRKSNTALQWATLGVCVVVLLVVLLAPRRPANGDERIDERIALAAKLVNRGLSAEAVAEYRAALDLARGDQARKARLCYLIGKTYRQSLKDYEHALAWLVRAEHYGLEGAERGQADRWIVECMERTGRSLDARNRIRRATSLEPNANETSGTVVAAIGDRKITMAELDAELRALPEYRQNQFSDAESKIRFLEEYVAKQLLVAAAERENLHHDARVLRQVDRLRNDVLVGAYYQREIEGNVTVSPEELRLYYDANKNDFLGPRDFTLSHMELSDETAASSAVAALENGRDFAELAREISANEFTRERGGRIGTWTERSPLPDPLGNEPALRAAIAALKRGKWTKPVKSASGRYQIVRADAVTTGTPRPFEEVKPQIDFRLKQEKRMRRQQEVLDRLRKAEGVVIYRDAFEGAKSSK